MATTPFNLPLTITKGINYGPVIFNFKQEDGTPFDLSSGGVWQVFSYARKTKDAKNKIDLAPVITDAANGEVTMGPFSDEATNAFMGGEYGWDLVLEAPTGERLGPYFAGLLRIKEINTHVV